MTTITPEITQAIIGFNEYAQRFEWVFPKAKAELKIGAIGDKNTLIFEISEGNFEQREIYHRTELVGLDMQSIAILAYVMKNEFESRNHAYTKFFPKNYIEKVGESVFEEMKRNGFLQKSPFVVQIDKDVDHLYKIAQGVVDAHETGVIDAHEMINYIFGESRVKDKCGAMQAYENYKATLQHETERN
jgi:hypothetical protein